MVTLHNFDEAAQTVPLGLKLEGGERLVDLIGEEHSEAGGSPAARSRAGPSDLLTGFWRQLGA